MCVDLVQTSSFLKFWNQTNKPHMALPNNQDRLVSLKILAANLTYFLQIKLSDKVRLLTRQCAPCLCVCVCVYTSKIYPQGIALTRSAVKLSIIFFFLLSAML